MGERTRSLWRPWSVLSARTAMLAAYGLPAEPALTTYRTAHPRASVGDLCKKD